MKNPVLFFLYLFCLSGLLQAQNRPRLVLPEGIHSIQALCFSPDGKYLLVGDEKRTHLMELSTGKELKILEGTLLEKGESISRNQKLGITKTDSGMYFWDIAGGWSLKKFIQKTKGTSIATLFNDERLLKSSYDTIRKSYRFRIMDIGTNKEISELPAGEGVYSVRFSTKGKYIATAGWQGELRLWEVETGKEKPLIGHRGLVLSATFSHDDKFLLSTGADSTARLFELETGKEIRVFRGHHGQVDIAGFHSDGSLIVTNASDSMARVFETRTGRLLGSFRQNTYDYLFKNRPVNGADFSSSGKKILIKKGNHLEIRDAKTGKLLDEYSHASEVRFAIFSPDGKNIASTDGKSVIMVQDGKLSTLGLDRNNLPEISALSFCPDGKSVLSAFSDSTIRRWDLASGREINSIKCQIGKIHSAEISPDGQYILAASRTLGCLLDAKTGKEILEFWKRPSTESIQKYRTFCRLRSAHFNEEGKQIFITFDTLNEKLVTFYASKILEVPSGTVLNSHYDTISENTFEQGQSLFSPDGKVFLNNHSKIRKSASGKLVAEIEPSKNKRKMFLWDRTLTSMDRLFSFSPDGKQLLIKPINDSLIHLVDVLTGREVEGFQPLYKKNASGIKFSPDGHTALIICVEQNGFNPDLMGFPDVSIFLIDIKSGKEIKFSEQSAERKYVLPHIINPQFSPDGKIIIATESNNKVSIRDAYSGKKFFTRLQLPGKNEFLVYDEDYRFDGSPGAMEKLYFVCGLEATELGQMKDALYVPGLAEKILNGEEINYKKLSELDFCNALPLLELHKEDPAGREFRIRQRRWPVHRLEIKVGGKTVKTIPAQNLGLQDNQAILRLTHAELEKFLVPGTENTLELLAFTRENGFELQSRRLEFLVKAPRFKAKPKLYMLMIGVNDYKDDELDLKFPVQDARALGRALETSAGKLLGKENVEVWNVQSRLGNQPVFTTPERAGIMKALEEIGKKAQTQDVLFIFFAGHGVMQGQDEKAFTFLTADASRLNLVGISTNDLKEWLSPEGPFQMMPNKTVLVYDACNSGQAAKELVSALTRDNDATERRRQIEDLGDKSGLFILSASAPDKPAYEISRLGQGLLTYSMLYSLKNNPLVMDDNLNGTGFLNLQKWFLETEREQNRIMTSMGLRQKAQPYGSANIRIGMVDEEVRSSISLLEEKPLVFCSNARDENDEDPLDLKNRVNDFLENAHARGISTDLSFVPSETPGAHVVKLVYRLNDGKVNCRILVFKNKNKIQENSIEAPETSLVKTIVQNLELLLK